MKKLLMAVMFLTQCYYLFSQTNTQGLQDSLVARFNRDDFKGFYDLGSPGWMQNNKPEGIIGWLSYIKSQTGNIGSSVLDLDSGKTKYYKWDTQKKMLSFVLTTSEGNGFEGFDFKSYHFPDDIIAAS